MLHITIPGDEFYDEEKEEFVYGKPVELTLEHSLVSLSKWESKWKKPFLSNTKEKTEQEILDYVRCMTITQKVPDSAYESLKRHPGLLSEITDYIQDPMTATTFASKGKPRKKGGPVITSELIYYWMIMYNIPVEFQKWHLNRLMTLIEVCQIKQSPKKKMSKKALMERNRNLNAQRRAKMGTRG